MQICLLALSLIRFTLRLLGLIIYRGGFAAVVAIANGTELGIMSSGELSWWEEMRGVYYTSG